MTGHDILFLVGFAAIIGAAYCVITNRFGLLDKAKALFGHK